MDSLYSIIQIINLAMVFTMVTMVLDTMVDTMVDLGGDMVGIGGSLWEPLL